MKKVKKRLGEILIEDGILTSENLEEALNYQKSHGGLIGQILITLGYIAEDSLVAALSAQLKIPYLPLANYSVNFDASKLLEEDCCRKSVMIAFDQVDDRIFLAVADPLNETALQDVEKKTNLTPKVFISTSTEILNMLDVVYSSGAQK